MSFLCDKIKSATFLLENIYFYFLRFSLVHFRVSFIYLRSALLMLYFYSLPLRLLFFLPLLSAPSSQVSTGARCSATRRGWGFLCWKPNGETRRRLRPSAPWPLSLWPTLMPWSKGKDPKPQVNTVLRAIVLT